MTASPIATAADYADAMLAARRAKNWLFLLLLLALMGQMAIFFVLRHDPSLMNAPSAAPTTSTPQSLMQKLPRALEFLVAGTGFLGIALAVILALVQLLIAGIMLVGRLIGVSKVTGAFIWSLLLVVLLFPWQAILLSPTSSSSRSEETPNATWMVPGVLYTWGELTHPTHGAAFTFEPFTTAANLRWARFVVFPGVALVLLLMIQVKSSRGLRMALGEVEVEAYARPAARPQM
jgi:hypothetical protein